MSSLKPVTAEDLARLEAHVQNHLSGHVRDLRVLLHPPGLVLQGRSRTYYGKQLAQHALMKVTQVPLVANQIEVVKD